MLSVQVPPFGKKKRTGAFGQRHHRTVFAIGGKHTVEAGQVDSGFRHQSSQPGDKIQGLENDMGRAIPIRCLADVVHP